MKTIGCFGLRAAALYIACNTKGKQQRPHTEKQRSPTYIYIYIYIHTYIHTYIYTLILIDIQYGIPPEDPFLLKSKTPTIHLDVAGEVDMLS